MLVARLKNAARRENAAHHQIVARHRIAAHQGALLPIVALHLTAVRLQTVVLLLTAVLLPTAALRQTVVPQSNVARQYIKYVAPRNPVAHLVRPGAPQNVHQNAILATPAATLAAIPIVRLQGKQFVIPLYNVANRILATTFPKGYVSILAPLPRNPSTVLVDLPILAIVI